MCVVLWQNKGAMRIHCYMQPRDHTSWESRVQATDDIIGSELKEPCGENNESAAGF